MLLNFFSYFCPKSESLMEPTKPLLLLSNDDGVTARGLNYLIETLAPLADLFVMAPDSPRSGAGCSLTSVNPVSYRMVHDEPGLTICSCSGTPVDCVKLALDQVMDRRPDLVIGGINHGSNASVNAHYSGTMGVVYEGAMKGYPAVAFSLCDHRYDADFTPLRPYLVDIMFKAIAIGLPRFTCLNVNFPLRPKFEGVRVCRMTYSSWDNEYVNCPHPHGGHYYWLTGDNTNLEPTAEDTDLWALDHGYVAITPTQVDVTAHGLIDTLKQAF